MSLETGSTEHVALWEAINALIEASGGRNGVSTARMTAVAKVESALRAALAESEDKKQPSWQAMREASRNRLRGYLREDREMIGRELSEEDAMVERAWQRFCAHVALTDDEILAMWVGGPVTRPVLGRNKVLTFARDIARAVLSNAGHAGRRELSDEEIAACLPGAEPFFALVGSEEILKFARAVLLRAAGGEE